MKRLRQPVLIGAFILSFAAICLFLIFRPGRRPNIILIVIDSLRADHMAIYGYERDTTPFLDAFGRENALFTRAISASNWTPICVASMFTGLYPTSHGMIPPTHRESQARRRSVRLSPEFDTLAEVLKRGGYRTAAVVTNPWTTPDFGFAQGFDAGDFVILMRSPVDVVAKSAAAILAKLQGEKAPFFLYLHLMDVHKPYVAPPEFDGLFREPLRDRRPPAAIGKELDLYDRGIRFTDLQIGEFFGELRRRGLYEEAVIIVTADHGEQFHERGYHGHGGRLYAEETHIPLIMKNGDPPRVIREPVSSIDIYPTIIGAARLAVPADTPALRLDDGRSLRKRRGVISEGFLKSYQKAFVSGEGKKIILDLGMPPGGEDQDPGRAMTAARVEGLFDLDGDPLEMSPFEDERLAGDLRKDLEAILRQALRRKRTAPAGTIQGKTLEQLESLGYLD